MHNDVPEKKDWSQLIEEYQMKLPDGSFRYSITHLAGRHNISNARVYQVINKHNVPTRSNLKSKKRKKRKN